MGAGGATGWMRRHEGPRTPTRGALEWPRCMLSGMSRQCQNMRPSPPAKQAGRRRVCHQPGSRKSSPKRSTSKIERGLGVVTSPPRSAGVRRDFLYWSGLRPRPTASCADGRSELAVRSRKTFQSRWSRRHHRGRTTDAGGYPAVAETLSGRNGLRATRDARTVERAAAFMPSRRRRPEGKSAWPLAGAPARAPAQP